jgi:hypothetical protein
MILKIKLVSCLVFMMFPFYTSCKFENTNRYNIDKILYFESDSSKIETISYLNTNNLNRKKIKFNYFGDTNIIEFKFKDRLDSIQYYIYFCNHDKKDTMNVTDWTNLTHNSRHIQIHTYTEIFNPSKRKIIYSDSLFKVDSIFQKTKSEMKSYN